MEINAEMNKVFGQEMAKLFAETITEEQMLDAARKTWNELNLSQHSQWHNNKSAFREVLDAVLIAEFKKKAEELAASKAYQTQIKKEVESIVEEIREATHKKLVENISTQLSAGISSPSGYLRGMFQEMIIQELHR